MPPLLVFLAKHPLVDKFDLSCIKVIYSGAAPLSQDIQNNVLKRIGKNKPLQVLQGYGMTELSILTTFQEHDVNSNDSSVGKLISGMSGKVSRSILVNYLIKYNKNNYFAVGYRFRQWKIFKHKRMW